MKCYEIIDHLGINRLSVKAVSRRFDGMLWERKDVDGWVGVLKITGADFQLGDGTRRFVDQLYSFDPDAGLAIIKIGQGDAVERSPGGVNFNYSWREWDLWRNRENRLLKVCIDPEAGYLDTA